MKQFLRRRQPVFVPGLISVSGDRTLGLLRSEASRRPALQAWAVLMLLAVLAGCVTNEAGRNRLALVSSDEMNKLGFASFDQMKHEMPISKDPAANQLVRKVGERIRAVVNLPGAQWEFVVFDSKDANAFCLPGGKVGVYTGILPITKDEAGLAAVLGHEVAHAVLEHGGERMSRGIALNTLGQGLGQWVDARNPRWTAAVGTLYGVGVQVGSELPHSRLQESEADYRGLIYMAKAGYDPEAAVAFWERFAAYNNDPANSKWLAFLRTHPLNEVRIQQLKTRMPEAKAIYQKR